MYEPGTAEGDTPATRRWRTVFHVIHENYCDGVFARVPSWSLTLAILIPWCQIAPELHAKIAVGGRYHGLCAIGADDYDGLKAYINET